MQLDVTSYFWLEKLTVVFEVVGPAPFKIEFCILTNPSGSPYFFTPISLTPSRNCSNRIRRSFFLQNISNRLIVETRRFFNVILETVCRIYLRTEKSLVESGNTGNSMKYYGHSPMLICKEISLANNTTYQNVWKTKEWNVLAGVNKKVALW